MSFRIVSRSVWGNPGNQGRLISKTIDAISWQLHKRLVKTPKIIDLVTKAKFKAHPDCVISSALIYADWPEFVELQFIRQQLQPSDLVLDVGANVGHLSLLLSDIVGPQGLYCFEPTPLTYGRLLENWKLNGWPTDQLFSCALGDSEGIVNMPNTNTPETKNSIVWKPESTPSIEVPIRPLDHFRPSWVGKSIGLFKVDVEGYEPHVFRGAHEILKHDRPRLIMFESLNGQPDPEVARAIESADYELFQLDENGKPQFSDLVA